MALISTHSLSVDTRLNNISIELQRGEVLGLIGPNGAGKSTLLNTLAGLGHYTGDILLESNNLTTYSSAERARMIGLQPQLVTCVWPMSVEEVVTLGRTPWGDNDEKAIQEAIKLAGINAFTERTIDHLSGGERARVWLARVLAGKPQALLVDEPVANVDIHYQLSVMNVLKNYAKSNNGVIVALHDLSLAARYCHRLCLLKNGKCVALGTPEEVLNESLLQDVYEISVDIDLERQPPIVLPK